MSTLSNHSEMCEAPTPHRAAASHLAMDVIFLLGPARFFVPNQ